MSKSEPEISYTAEAPAVGWGQTPDLAIDALLAEVGKPEWGKWWIFGVIRLEPDLDAEDRQIWMAQATMNRNVEVEI